jgi:hypothetical protein
MAKRSTSSRTNAEKVSSRIKLASEFEQFERFLVYGISGSGKTRFAASAPKVLLIDVDEKGTASVRRDIDPPVFRVERWGDMNDVYWYLQAGDHPYDSVAIDGITGLQTLCMNYVLGEEAARDASRDPDMPTRQAYGKCAQLMKTQIANFRNLEMNVIFTALTRTDSADEDDDLGETVTGPACQPAVAGRLEAACDTIGYLHTRQVVARVRGTKDKKKVTRRRLIVGPHERYVTKDRNGLFGEFVDSPDVAKMLTIIRGEGDVSG